VQWGVTVIVTDGYLPDDGAVAGEQGAAAAGGGGAAADGAQQGSSRGRAQQLKVDPSTSVVRPADTGRRRAAVVVVDTRRRPGSARRPRFQTPARRES